MVHKEFPDCFMIRNWYDNFKDLTIETRFFDIDSQIIEYINSETFSHPSQFFNFSDNLVNFKNAINKSIKSFGGSVYIKLLCSSPKDSGWLSFNKKPEISDFDELCLLIKCSNNLELDLQKISKIKTKNLALRKVVDINKALEFRCFILDKRLKAISQRHIDTYYNFLENMQSEIVENISLFFDKKFFGRSNFDNCVVDVFLDDSLNVKIMDISPFDQFFVNSLLFDWQEISEFSEVSYRVIKNCEEVVRDIHTNNGFPIEIMNLDEFSDQDLVRQAVHSFYSQLQENE